MIISKSMRLSGKTAFVTGASRGIGAAIARRFAAEGARVCLAARSSGETLRIAREIASAGGEAIAVECDVTRPESYGSALGAAVERWKTIDVLVNNAGTSGLTPVAGGSSEEDAAADATWDAVLATNLTAVWRVTRAATRHIPDGGRIVNLSSVLGRFGVPGLAAYVATKHAVIGLTRTMALELAPRKITANAICPGWVETDLARQGYRRIASGAKVTEEEARAICARMAPLGRVLDPEEIAGLAAYMASDDARDLTGQAIVLDGGQVMP
ncbi:MAG TPA: SDR family NAD(P)-dependent oxidoreductase [Thermoanaerobaculia bacterium]|nr:SDR family NAD(P)-dependent oxidoreductase [Thermoanaerobaculia bacterium]